MASTTGSNEVNESLGVISASNTTGTITAAPRLQDQANEVANAMFRAGNISAAYIVKAVT